jgi:hypothetical protein
MQSVKLTNITLIFKVGTDDSGHWGHYGRPGLVGGSRARRGHRRSAPPIETYAIESQWIYGDYEVGELARTADELRRQIRRDRGELMYRYINYRGYSREEAREQIAQELAYSTEHLQDARRELERRINELIYRGEVPNDLWYVDGAPDNYNQLSSFGQPEGYSNAASQMLGDRAQEPTPQIEPTVVAPASEAVRANVQNKMVAFMQDWQSIPIEISNDIVHVNTADFTQEEISQLEQKFGFNLQDIKKMVYLPNTTANVSIRIESDSMIGIRAYIYQAGENDTNVAYLNYELMASEGKPNTFYAGYLKIGDRFRDKDYGTTLVTRHAMMAKMAGYKTMEFSADITIGKYAWAKEGANFKDNEGQLFRARMLMKTYASAKFDAIYRQPGVREAFMASLNNLHSAYDIATFKYPGMTTYGRYIRNDDVSRDMPLEFGKAFLLDDDSNFGSWHAVVDLTKLGGF